MHGRPLVCRDDAFVRWRPQAQGAVWPDRIIVATPSFDQDLCLAHCGEDLTIEQPIYYPPLVHVNMHCRGSGQAIAWPRGGRRCSAVR